MKNSTRLLNRILFIALCCFFQFAKAQIVYTDVIPDSTSTGSYNLDLNNDGTPDFLIAHTISYGACNHINDHLKISPQNGSKCSAKNRAEGVVISSSLSYFAAEDQTMVAYRWERGPYGCVLNTSDGTWDWAVNGYLALELVVSGNIYYGWARLNTYGASSFTIKDYAFNSNPDSSIVAGQTCPPQAVITATGSTTFCAGDSVILSSSNAGTNLSYKWKLNGSNISAATNKSFTVKIAGKYKVNVKDNTNGCSATSASVKVKIPCRVLNEELSADENVLLKGYPNPFSQSTTISFSLPQSKNVSLKIFDVEGRLIRTLANDVMSAGEHELTWDAQDEQGNAVSAKVYLLQFSTSENSETIRLSIMK
jgi:hypothetical protein